MARGVIDKVYLADELVNDRICEVTCVLNDATRVNPRKTSFVSLVAPNYFGEVKSDVYEIEVEVPYATVAELAAPIDAVVTSFDLTADTIDVVSAGSYIVIGNENMIVQSITGNTVTVFARGHGGTIAAAHTTDEKVQTMANVKATCEAIGDCRLPSFKTTIENATQKFDDCVSYCEEDLCKGLKENCDVAGRDRVINDAKEKQQAVVRKNMLEQLDNLFINGSYGFVTKGGKKAYTTRGLRQWALGLVDGEGVTHSGFVYDYLAEDACNGTAGTGDGFLTYNGLQAFYEAAGAKVAPQWTHVILNWNSFMALDKVADKCETCIAPNGTPTLRNKFISQTISTPYGDVQVLINEHMRDGEMIFFNEANVGWYSDCSINGQVFQENEINTDFTGKNKKWYQEGYLAFDASRNLCSDLAIMTNFKRDTTC